MTAEDPKSMVKEFYADANIFITGATGFLGKALLEKLLRTCTSIKRIFILIRPKKGKDIHTRLDEIFDSELFDTLKKVSPKFIHKIQVISGDCTLPDLGISRTDYDVLIDAVNIVFHVAATVKFDEKLPVAAAINVQSTQDVMKMCVKMKNLKSVIHVSTAYAHCTQNEIDEKFYKTPMKPEHFLDMVNTIPDDALECSTPTILGDWPNSYTFSKAISEDVILQNGGYLPVGMFRPAVVTSTFKEPLVAWSDNLYGPAGVVAGASTGIMRTAMVDPNVDATIVPVDYCVNALIASAWDVVERRKQETISTEPCAIPVYNFVTDPDNTLSWRMFMTIGLKYGLWKPTIQTVWFTYIILTRSTIMFTIYKIFLHLIPAAIVDGVCFCLGKKQKMLYIYKRVHKLVDVLKFFTTNSFNFKNENVRHLWTKLSAHDKQDFPFDMRSLNWDEYFQNYFVGIRQYVLHDPLSTLPEAIRRFRKFYLLHLLLKAAFYIFLLRVLWEIIAILYSNLL